MPFLSSVAAMHISVVSHVHVWINTSKGWFIHFEEALAPLQLRCSALVAVPPFHTYASLILHLIVSCGSILVTFSL